MSKKYPSNSHSIEDGTSLAENLLARCEQLLHELQEFRTFVDERKAEHEHAVDIKKFQTCVDTEYRSLTRVPFSLAS